MTLLGTLWQIEYLARLRRHAGTAPSRRAHRRRMQRLADRTPFHGSDFARTIATGLEAAAEHLEEAGRPRAEAARLAGETFVATGRWSVDLTIRLWLALDRDPVTRLRAQPERLSASATRLWGNGMRAKTVSDAEGVALHITDCPFAEYFWTGCRPDLAPWLCAWDAAWMATANRRRRPMEVRRPTTLLTGANSCCFRFDHRPAAAPPPSPLLPPAQRGLTAPPPKCWEWPAGDAARVAMVYRAGPPSVCDREIFASGGSILWTIKSRCAPSSPWSSNIRGEWRASARQRGNAPSGAQRRSGPRALRTSQNRG